MSASEESRYESICNKLDANGDGRIDIQELSAALRDQGVPEDLKKGYAEVIFFCCLCILYDNARINMI